jgi:RNA polymerase sigma factor (sigma-70 family)
VDDSLAGRLYRAANAERWGVRRERFAEALEISQAHAHGDAEPAPHVAARYLQSLHVEDLALATACADGNDTAWEHFVTEQRPGLYRAANAIDPGGNGRELADSLYAELFGVGASGGQRASLFRYFHGRSSLATWLRAVLAQRHVDRIRAERCLEPLPDEESGTAVASSSRAEDPDRARWVALMNQALAGAVARLNPRDRLRLGCYYAQRLTLAEIGRLVGEHEGTVSRALARTRTSIREDIERHLGNAGLDAATIAECFRSVMDDAGTIDLNQMLETIDNRKESAGDRSV